MATVPKGLVPYAVVTTLIGIIIITHWETQPDPCCDSHKGLEGKLGDKMGDKAKTAENFKQNHQRVIFLDVALDWCLNCWLVLLLSSHAFRFFLHSQTLLIFAPSDEKSDFRQAIAPSAAIPFAPRAVMFLSFFSPWLPGVNSQEPSS